MSLLAIDVGSLSKGDDKREGRYMGSWMSLVSDMLFQECI
jgi:hypothetical protein